MGKANLAVGRMMERPDIFSDYVNGTTFGGRQVLSPEDLELISTHGGEITEDEKGHSKVHELEGDIRMKGSMGTYSVILVGELQSHVHYAMPVRDMRYVSEEYRKQLEDIEKKHREKKDLMTSDEFLSKFAKDDKLMPVASSVLYWGTKWDGPTELYDMLDFGDGREAEALKEYVPNYKIKVVSMAEFENPDVFRSCLQHIFRMVQCKEDRKQLEEYMNVHKDEFQQMDSVEKEAVVMILGEGTNVARQFEKAAEEGRVEAFDMCGAFKEMISDGKLEIKIEQVCKKLRKNKTVEVIADELEDDVDFIEKMVNLAMKFAPEYDVEKILEAWKEQNPKS